MKYKMNHNKQCYYHLHTTQTSSTTAFQVSLPIVSSSSTSRIGVLASGQSATPHGVPFTSNGGWSLQFETILAGEGYHVTGPKGWLAANWVRYCSGSSPSDWASDVFTTSWKAACLFWLQTSFKCQGFKNQIKVKMSCTQGGLGAHHIWGKHKILEKFDWNFRVLGNCTRTKRIRMPYFLG